MLSSDNHHRNEASLECYLSLYAAWSSHNSGYECHRKYYLENHAFPNPDKQVNNMYFICRLDSKSVTLRDTLGQEL